MARRIVTKVKIAEVKLDKEIYPRSEYSHKVGYIYSQSMLSGAKFPPIVIAVYKGIKYLIDGKHRLEAKKILKETEIEAEVHFGWSWKKMFEESISRNIAHGRMMSPFEKRRLALKMKAMKYSKEEISSLLSVPAEKLDHFIAQRLVNSITGETISESIVKTTLKHKAGKTYSPEELSRMESTQIWLGGKSQVNLLQQINELFEEGLIDLEDEKVQKELEKLFGYIQQIAQ